jgi:hypothetical protein
MPHREKHEFEFASDLTGFRAPGWQIVRLSKRLRRKDDLLRALAAGLRFPAYFGHNWDALEECLRDLTWLGPDARVVLLHKYLPLSDDQQQQIYLDILRNAHATGHVPLRVVFPESPDPRLDG